MRRSLTASGATSPPKQPSTALALAMWWLAGQTPQIRVTLRGSSSFGLPTTNRSKPRSSGIWK
jgi:hypothetical protein